MLGIVGIVKKKQYNILKDGIVDIIKENIIVNMYNCTNCNEEIEGLPFGSLGFPYCKRCFKLIWKNDYSSYYRWLRRAYKTIPKYYYKKKEKVTSGSGSTLPINEETNQL